MLPTLRDGSWYWSTPARGMPPQRGQVVVVRLRRPPVGLFVKRVVGLPHETIEICDASVKVNSRDLAEPYVLRSAGIEPQKSMRWDLQSREFIVLGDTRDDSLDSRRFGPIDLSEIDAFLQGCLWPFWKKTLGFPVVKVNDFC